MAKDYKGKIDFAIITIREDENRAVLKRFPTEEIYQGTHRSYAISRVPLADGSYYLVATIRSIEQGEGHSQDVARDIIEDLDPQWILLVGIAGGVPAAEITFGDVVVAMRLTDFSVKAALEGREPQYAISGGPMHKKVQDLLALLPAMTEELEGWNSETSIGMTKPKVALTAKNFYGSDNWKEKTKESLTRHFGRSIPLRPPLVTTGVVASGDTLMKDSQTLQKWQESARKLIAIEMELAGVYIAARRQEKEYPILAIRGISDIVGFKRHPDWTEYACQSAAAFTHRFIRSEPILSKSKLMNDTSNISFQQTMIGLQVLQVFLCHGSEDKSAVRDLYKRLYQNGINPWLDEEDILPGQDWEIQIANAIKCSHAIIVCLSRSILNKEGYVQREIAQALNVAEEKPEDTVFIIPAKLEECKVPVRLSKWQWVNLFEPNGYQKLLTSLQTRSEQLRDRSGRISQSKVHLHNVLPDQHINSANNTESVTYEAIYLVPGNITSGELSKLIENYKKIVTDYNGIVFEAGVDGDGKRRLAYEIDGNREAVYVLMRFLADEKTMQELSLSFRNDNNIIRHIIAKQVNEATPAECPSEPSPKLLIQQHNRMICLVGDDPLSVFLGIKQIAGPDVELILVTSSSSRSIADRIMHHCIKHRISQKVRIVELPDLLDGKSVASALKQLPLNRGYILNYTGGIKAMVAHALSELRQTLINTFYFEARDRIFRFDKGSDVPLVVAPNTSDICTLNGIEFIHSLFPGEDGIVDEEKQFEIRIFKYFRALLPTTSELYFRPKFMISGEWFEADVVTLCDLKLCITSVTSRRHAAIIKAKAFEAIHRAHQIAGQWSSACVICLADNHMVEGCRKSIGLRDMCQIFGKSDVDEWQEGDFTSLARFVTSTSMHLGDQRQR